MCTTEVVNVGGDQMVKLPKEFHVESGPVSIRREGETLILEPVKATSWPTGFFECIHIDDAKLARPDQEGDLPQRFARLVAEWKSARGHSSKMKELVMHRAYQQIIGMGESAVPLLLNEMRERPDHWDWALRAITGTDPVPRESWGKLGQIAAAWVAWGTEKGYIAS